MIKSILDCEINNGTTDIWLEDDKNELVAYHVSNSKVKGTIFTFLYEGCPINTVVVTEQEQTEIVSFLKEKNITLG